MCASPPGRERNECAARADRCSPPRDIMVAARSLALLFAALVALATAAPPPAAALQTRFRRQLADDNTLQPLDSGTTWRALVARQPRQASTRRPDDIPVFDRNKVSLDFPGNLFGPSVSLLIRTTKVIGDVIQNSAVRYQSFLRLFRPLFRGPFEIKGLDPPTTTTTTTTTRTTTTSTAAPLVTDNEVRRRRHLVH